RAYGSVYTPTEMGSAGQNGQVSGGWGGAALRMTVTGTAVLNGTIDVSGASGASSSYAGGGGAGGSLWITVGTLGVSAG
ncbi:hypothetical protein OFC53_38925, partial [Escherichia coli]|nr:hypothetical protein [Escherichia coli]